MLLFLTLNTFDATGGIEKVCRIAGKAFYEFGIENNEQIQIKSLHDSESAAVNNIYFPRNIFKGFKGNIPKFILNNAIQGRKARIVVLSHINLLPVGWLIKFISPKTRLVLITHGIEIWNPVKRRVLKMLRSCDRILAVSSYTRNRVIEVHKIDTQKCNVLNNCLDPFLELPVQSHKLDLRKRYGFSSKDIIIFTLTRISSDERYKGYDKVINALISLNVEFENLKYLIAGSYDKTEKARIDKQIKDGGLENKIVFTGYVKEEELASHFQMADMYVMPSKKEGFGLVFIEAMFYSLPVIAGNIDGSCDALMNGELGLLINPDNVEEIKEAIKKVILNKNEYVADKKLMLSHFGYDSYKANLKQLICYGF